MFRGVLQQSSGRVIALGRLMLATLFLLAIWLDSSQPAQAAAETYALLGGYVALSLGIVVAVWRDWWLDARSAPAVHLLDVLIFTVLVYATEGYTSPFFLFFVFLLLSAAIRWGWRETALTAVAVVALYLLAGLLVAEGAEFELQRFVIRTGHLVILSLILIWFGINQGRARFTASADQLLADSDLDDPPLHASLRAAKDACGALSGALLWCGAGDREPRAVFARHGSLRHDRVAELPLRDGARDTPFLYDLQRRRAITRGAGRRLRFVAARRLLDPDVAREIGLTEGLAIPLRTQTGHGVLFLEGVPSLSTDHLAFGRELALDIALHLQRHALLRAVEESAEARSRLSVARDLHDSVVQFLAGTGFRIEGAIRRAKSGHDVEPELRELKTLVLQEQRDLRAFIRALRDQDEVTLRELAEDLRSLTEKLARQWNVECALRADLPEVPVPARLHLDTHQLVREAVANAVRHGKASSMEIAVSLDDGSLRLDLSNDGSGFPEAMIRSRDSDSRPWSLQERVDEAGGELALSNGPGCTRVTVTLPIRSARD